MNTNEIIIALEHLLEDATPAGWRIGLKPGSIFSERLSYPYDG